MPLMPPERLGNDRQQRSEAMAGPDALVRALAQRLGHQIAVASETITDARGLHDAELSAVSKAIPKRQAEFAAGRRAARRALVTQGAGNVALPAGAARAPVWPKGIVGSITHDQGVALAAVANTQDISALGIDLTEAAPLPGRTREAILRAPSEQALSDLEARAAFSVKECLFKALYPEVQVFFGFEAAVAKPDLNAHSFTARLTIDLGPYQSGASFSGVLVTSRSLIITALAVPA